MKQTPICIALVLCILLVSFPLTIYGDEPQVNTQTNTIDTINETINSIPSDWPSAPDIESEAAIVVEVNSGTILYGKNATKSMYPASTTKLMTALLTVENTSLNDVVTFSSKAVHSLPAGSSHIGLRAGEKLTVEDSLYGLLLPSANEVANGLAEHIGGSIDNFVTMMNERATSLGAVNTHFQNANGLSDSNHTTCAYDLYLIMNEAIKYPSFLRIDSTPTYVRPADELLNKTIPMGSTHQMLRTNSPYYNPYVVAGKTGYTPEANRCLVTYAVKDDMKLIIVVLHAPDGKQYEDTNALMEYGFEQFKLVRPSEQDSQYSNNSLSTSTPLQIPQQVVSLAEVNSKSQLILPRNASFSDLEKQALTSTETTTLSNIQYFYHGYPVGTATLLENTNQNTNDLFVSTSLSNPYINNAKQLYIIQLWHLLIIFIVIIGIICYTHITKRVSHGNHVTKKRKKIRFSKQLKRTL